MLAVKACCVAGSGPESSSALRLPATLPEAEIGASGVVGVDVGVGGGDIGVCGGAGGDVGLGDGGDSGCLLYTSPSPRD